MSAHSSLRFDDLHWIALNGAPTAQTVLDFFRGPEGSSPFWDRNCTNELCIQQGRDLFEVAKMAGVRYEVVATPLVSLRVGDACIVNAGGRGTPFLAVVRNIHLDRSIEVMYAFDRSTGREPSEHVRPHPPSSFTIRKVRRFVDERPELVEAVFYVTVSYAPVSASAYRCPDVETVVAARVENTAFHLRSAFESLLEQRAAS